jgi:hypothetical protein
VLDRALKGEAACAALQGCFAWAHIPRAHALGFAAAPFKGWQGPCLPPGGFLRPPALRVETHSKQP